MKTQKSLTVILFVLVPLFYSGKLHGQIRTLKNKPVQTQKNPAVLANKSGIPAVTDITKSGMTLALNGIRPKPIENSGILEGYDQIMSGLKAARDEYINGNGTSGQYPIRYSSAAVKSIYDEMVAPLVANSGYILVHHTFNEMIADQLVQGAVNSGLYTAPGALGKLEEAIRKEMSAIDIQNPAAIQTNSTYKKNVFFDKPLAAILAATAGQLSKENAKTNADKGNFLALMKSTFFTEYQRAVLFFKNDAVDICIKTAQASKWKASHSFFLDEYGRTLQKAVKGELFKSIRSFHGQASEFEVFTIRMHNLQKGTQNATLGSLWDKDCDCPSALTFSIFQANKVRNANVYNP